ncbi:hypothetical protein Pfo_015338 [Paulownia fortunei]|nr:hypothetical protein Pfo_015338 [Paulownia fortunei]
MGSQATTYTTASNLNRKKLYKLSLRGLDLLERCSWQRVAAGRALEGSTCWADAIGNCQLLQRLDFASIHSRKLHEVGASLPLNYGAAIGDRVNVRHDASNMGCISQNGGRGRFTLPPHRGNDHRSSTQDVRCSGHAPVDVTHEPSSKRPWDFSLASLP